MKVYVVNGSPKGESSTTYYHVKFLEKHFKDVSFEYAHVALHSEHYLTHLDTVLERMSKCDVILWIYPIYALSVPFQMMQFIEGLYKHDQRQCLKNKFTSQICTSKFLLDITAQGYIKAVCEDFEMKIIEGLSLDMDAVLTKDGQYKLIDFMDKLKDHHANKISYGHVPKPMTQLYDFEYAIVPEHEKKKAKIMIVYNGETYSKTLEHMIMAFENICPYEVHRLDLSNVHIKNGCIGCHRCLLRGVCIYDDEFEHMYHEKVSSADVLIYASDIQHHFLHSDFKLLDDRAFYHGFRLNREHKAIGFILTGHYQQEINLQHILKAKAQLNCMNFLEPVTNEQETIKAQITRLCYEIDYFIRNKPYPKESFLSVGAMKIYRDIVYEKRGMLQKDHEYFKRYKLYDYPRRRSVKNFILKRLYRLMKHESIYKKVNPMINNRLIAKYQKVIDEA